MKKSKKFVAVSLLASTLALVSCDDIYPDLNPDTITISEGSEDVFTEENLTYIYEKLHDTSSTGEEVRDYILRQYSISLFGNYSMDENGNIVLEGYDGKTNAEQLEFVRAHKLYWDLDAESLEVTEPNAFTTTIASRIETIRDLIRREAIETIFSEANADTYKVDNYFYEYLYARAKFESSEVGDFDPSFKANNIYDKEWEMEIDDPALPNDFPFTNKILIDSSISSDNIDSIIGTDNSTGVRMLNIALYNDYINLEVIPDIMNTLLISQYIYDNQYTTLSRTQSRHINYVAINYDSTNVNAARRLINQFVENNIANAPVTSFENYQSIDFDVLADLWKGIYDDDGTDGVSSASSEIASLYDGARFNKVTTHQEAVNGSTAGTSYIDGKDHTYYQYTQYGALMENFAKLNSNRNDAESNSQWSSFTNSNQYSYTHGLELQINSIKVEDYTHSGWGTSSSGFSSLPAAVTDNLFQYEVSIDTTLNRDLFDENSTYVTLVNGRYFLKRSTALSNNLVDSIVINDSSNSTFYIVEIIDALSQNKMSLNTNYAENGAYDVADKFEIARDVGYTLASGDTYTNTAYLYYLEQCNIEYNDQSIYEYMLETYPDLFDDED